MYHISIQTFFYLIWDFFVLKVSDWQFPSESNWAISLLWTALTTQQHCSMNGLNYGYIKNGKKLNEKVNVLQVTDTNANFTSRNLFSNFIFLLVWLSEFVAETVKISFAFRIFVYLFSCLCYFFTYFDTYYFLLLDYFCHFLFSTFPKLMQVRTVILCFAQSLFTIKQLQF